MSLIEDPDDGQGADPIVAASWGSFQLWAENRNLCVHVDQGEILSSVHWYLLPLAEWLVENWDALLHEEKLPDKSASTGVDSLELDRISYRGSDLEQSEAREQQQFEWRSRHVLRSGREGGLFPNVVFRRLRDYIEISWDSTSEVGAPPGFEFSAGQGSALLEPRDVATPLHEVLVDLSRTLTPISGRSRRILELSERLSALSSPELVDHRLSWFTGSWGAIEGRNLWSRVKGSISGPSGAVAAALDTVSSLLVVERACPAALLFASVSPEISADDVRTLTTVLLEQHTETAVSRLDEIVEDVRIDERGRAWEQGYELAETLHDGLGLDTSAGWFDLERFLAAYGVRILDRTLTDSDIAACSIVSPHHIPTVVLNNASHRVRSGQLGRRFTLAHELCHLLHDRAVGSRLAIASGPWAPRAIEQRAGAFAAMLLLPPHLVESSLKRIGTPITTLEGVTELASSVRLSRSATIWHLSNMALLSEAERDRLLRELRP